MQLKPTALGPREKLPVLSKQPIRSLEAKPPSRLLNTFTAPLTSVFSSRHFRTKFSICSLLQSLNLPEAYYRSVAAISLHIPLLFSSALSLLFSSCFLLPFFSVPSCISHTWRRREERKERGRKKRQSVVRQLCLVLTLHVPFSLPECSLPGFKFSIVT